MDETRIELLIKKKTPAYLIAVKFLCYMLTAAFVFIGFIIWPALIIGAIFGFLSYLLYLNCDLEYEYLYFDKELTIDKIMAKSRRKKVASYDINKMEILAPIKSYHLDNFKNRKDKTSDYSSREEKQPDERYVFFYDGRERIIIEPNDKLIRALYMLAPRKVFKD